MLARPGSKSVEEVGRSFSCSSIALQQGLILSEFPKKPSSKIELQVLPWDYYSSPCWLPPVTERCLRILGCSSDAVPEQEPSRAYLLWMQCAILKHVGKKWQNFALERANGHSFSLQKSRTSLVLQGFAMGIRNGPAKNTHCRNKSPIACFITAPPTAEIDRVRGMSLGQASTQFCA
jgi:hypothetical protein